MLKFTNPRLTFTTNDWPYGSKRTTATFTIEANKRGERVSRVTINPKSGRINKPKTTTYATKVRIVDGSDGRTYIAHLTEYGFIKIMQSNLQYSQETIHHGNDRFSDVVALFYDNQGA